MLSFPLPLTVRRNGNIAYAVAVNRTSDAQVLFMLCFDSRDNAGASMPGMHLHKTWLYNRNFLDPRAKRRVPLCCRAEKSVIFYFTILSYAAVVALGNRVPQNGDFTLLYNESGSCVYWRCLQGKGADVVCRSEQSSPQIPFCVLQGNI